MSKTAALLGTGPSLLEYEDDPTTDLVFAINGAVNKFACDWWVFGDYLTYRFCKPWTHTRKHDIQLFVADTFLDMHYEEAKDMHAGWIRGRTVRRWLKVDKKPQTWRVPTASREGYNNRSMCAAIVLAVNLDVERIDLFGVDLAGDKYFNGAKIMNYDDGKRWETERILLEKLTTWAAKHGCEVVNSSAQVTA